MITQRTVFRPKSGIVLVAIIILGLLLLGTVYAAGVKAAALPYTYTFDKADLKIIVDFDYDVDSIVDQTKIEIAVDGSQIPAKVLKISDVSREGNKKLILKVEGLDPCITNYKITIPVGALAFKNYQQLDDFTIKFKHDEITSGLKSTFIDPPAGPVNEILRLNAPRDISIIVPKVFITGIETLHRYEGLIPEEVEDRIVGPNLSNVDIFADCEVDRVRISTGGVVNRELEKCPTLDGFTTGYAGLDAGVGADDDTGSDLTIYANDVNGKIVEKRTFKLRVTDPKEDFIVNDYIDIDTKIRDRFGKNYTLYELMQDPQILEDIITRIPVSELDSLGVSYANTQTIATVADLNQLARAVADPRIKAIKLAANLTLGADLILTRDLIFNGQDKTITGNLELGNGQDNLNLILRNLVLKGDLTIDVGSGGTAILDKVRVDGVTTIISGGTASIYLHNFSSSYLVLDNDSDIRMVITGNSSITDTKITATSTGNVNLRLDDPAKITNLSAYRAITVLGTGTITTGIGFVTPTVWEPPETNTANPDYITAVEKNNGVDITVKLTASGVVVGDILELLLDGKPWHVAKRHVLTAGNISASSYEFTINKNDGWGLDGKKEIIARITDAATGVVSAESSALNVTLDTAPPLFTVTGKSISGGGDTIELKFTEPMQGTLGAPSTDITSIKGSKSDSFTLNNAEGTWNNQKTIYTIKLDETTDRAYIQDGETLEVTLANTVTDLAGNPVPSFPVSSKPVAKEKIAPTILKTSVLGNKGDEGIYRSGRYNYPLFFGSDGYFDRGI